MIGYYEGTLIGGKGQGVTYGDNLTRFKYIEATLPKCQQWSYLSPDAPPEKPKEPDVRFKTFPEADLTKPLPNVGVATAMPKVVAKPNVGIKRLPRANLNLIAPDEVVPAIPPRPPFSS